MKQHTAEQKHEILLHLENRREGQSPDDIAALHGVAGGRQTLHNWRRQWDGTPHSLEHKRGAGRPRALS
jgi:transposase-like protein